MSRVTVEVDEDHLAGLLKNARAGLAELIWNSLDADANRVDVSTSTNDLGGPETVTE
ncbi:MULTISPECIES: hypothetical protein [unclassified Frankia]|uniref:hypothetical protein n=1 Tax=unclassified Frankia TaxID=2632575 RepID=UPI002AD4A281|nr:MULTISPECIES: hypothetical protein [unclassified Frankia]